MNPNDLIEPISKKFFNLQMAALKLGAENLLKDAPPFQGSYSERLAALNGSPDRPGWLDQGMSHAREIRNLQLRVDKAQEVAEGWQNRPLAFFRRTFRLIPGKSELNQMAAHADKARTIISNGLTGAAYDLRAFRATAAAAGGGFTPESAVVSKVSRLELWMETLAKIARSRTALTMVVALGAAGAGYVMANHSDKTSEQTGYARAVLSQPKRAWDVVMSYLTPKTRSASEPQPRLAAGQESHTPTTRISV